MCMKGWNIKSVLKLKTIYTETANHIVPFLVLSFPPWELLGWFEISFQSSPCPAPKMLLLNHPICPSAGISRGWAEVPGSFVSAVTLMVGVTPPSPAHCRHYLCPHHLVSPWCIWGTKHTEDTVLEVTVPKSNPVLGHQMQCTGSAEQETRYLEGITLHQANSAYIYYLYRSLIHCNFSFYIQPQNAHPSVPSRHLNTGISRHFIRPWAPYLASTCSRKTWGFQIILISHGVISISPQQLSQIHQGI